MTTTAATWIHALGLTPHPEGGYFTETYQSPDVIAAAGLPSRYPAARTCAKAIYFLLPADQVSKFHRLRCEEIWCYHAGASLTLSLLAPDGALQHMQLGPELAQGEQLQCIIPHGVWFGAKVNKKDAYTLLSCITAPGFDFADFELAERDSLLAVYPQHRELITVLT